MGSSKWWCRRSRRSFSSGVLDKNNREIYIPWNNFQGESVGQAGIKYVSVTSKLYEDAEQIAKDIHPAWHRCSEKAKRLYTRNVFQVLGASCTNPSKMVIYWAPEINGVPQGGTATAVKLAQSYDIPCYNLLLQEN